MKKILFSSNLYYGNIVGICVLIFLLISNLFYPLILLNNREFTSYSPLDYQESENKFLNAKLESSIPSHAIGYFGEHAWTFRTNGTIISTPAIGNVDADPPNEILIGSGDQTLYCISSIGFLKWKFEDYEAIISSPTLVDINNDGQFEVVFGSFDGYVYCLNGTQGDVIWSFPSPPGFTSDPAVGDVDNDGVDEIIIGSLDSFLYCLTAMNGSLEWKFETGDRINTAPAIGNLDDDTQLEIVFSSSDTKLYCLDGYTGKLEWFREANSAYFSNPALGDVNNDGQIEVVVGTDNGAQSSDNFVYCFSGQNGEIVWTFNCQESVTSGVAIGNINGDIFLDVVFGANNYGIFCLNGLTGKEQWRNINGSGYFTVPALGDLNGDGIIEVIIGSYYSGYYFLNSLTGEVLRKFSLFESTDDYIVASPVLCDGASDGIMDAILVSGTDTVICFSGNGEKWAIPGPWPMRGISALHGANIHDSDNDLLPDILEQGLFVGLDHNNNDTDNDNFEDGWEVQYHLNPLQYTNNTEDLDGDGLTNIEERNNGTSPIRMDSDGDSMPDLWELQNGLDPTNLFDGTEDLDGDGLVNWKEYKRGSNPNLKDSDNDGFGDKIDLFPMIPSLPLAIIIPFSLVIFGVLIIRKVRK